MIDDDILNYNTLQKRGIREEGYEWMKLDKRSFIPLLGWMKPIMTKDKDHQGVFPSVTKQHIENYFIHRQVVYLSSTSLLLKI